MRAFLDSILQFVNADSLTDEEWETIEALSLTTDFTVEVFEALDSTLSARESVSSLRDRLRSYFVAAGVSVAEQVGSSQIYLGGVL